MSLCLAGLFVLLGNPPCLGGPLTVAGALGTSALVSWAAAARSGVLVLLLPCTGQRVLKDGPRGHIFRGDGFDWHMTQGTFSGVGGQHMAHVRLTR